MLLLAMLAGLTLPGQETVPPTESPTTLSEVEVVAPITEGTVEMECRLDNGGRLRDCIVISESPRGQGIGEAALEATSKARLNPRSDDRTGSGGKVRFTTRFRLADSERPLT